MPEAGGVSFRRIRVPVGDREIWIDWDDPPDGSSPIPFRVWTIAERGGADWDSCRLVTEADVVGWRRAPDPVPGPGEDAQGAAASGPGPGEQR